jgi:hypothetical protein
VAVPEAVLLRESGTPDARLDRGEGTHLTQRRDERLALADLEEQSHSLGHISFEEWLHSISFQVKHLPNWNVMTLFRQILKPNTTQEIVKQLGPFLLGF